MRDLDSVFDSIIELKDNWNGYGAKSFNKSFVERCRNIIKGLDKEPFIAPTANNTIQLEYENENGYLEFEIYPDMKAKVFKQDSDGKHFTFYILAVNSEVINMVSYSFNNIS